MKMRLLAFLLLISTEYTFAVCLNNGGSIGDSVDSVSLFAQEILNLMKLNSTKLMGIKIKLDGAGDVNIYQDEKGNLLGIGLSYIGSEKLQEAHSVTDMNNGAKIKYTVPAGQTSPLVLAVKPGTAISPMTGGTFQVTIKTEKAPDKFQSYDIQLKKENGKWVASHAKKNVTLATIGVNIGISGWKGTFSKIYFE